MSKRMGKRGRGTGPFVQIFRYMMQSPAWTDLSPTARALYVELKALFNGKNNGALGFSTRDAGTALNLGKSSASRYFQELEAHGFIVREKRSSFHQKRLAVEWRLTELKNDATGDLASKEFARWGKVNPSKDGSKKQNPVPSVGSIGRSTGLEHLSPAGTAPSSPTHRPANRKLAVSQSQERAASTILPGGTPDNSTARPALPAVMKTHARTRLSDASPVAQAISAYSESRIGLAVVAPAKSIRSPPGERESFAAWSSDPMVMAVLAAFPGAQLVSRHVTDVTQDSDAEEVLLWSQEASDGDILDVVPHGYEREFWMELS